MFVGEKDACICFWKLNQRTEMDAYTILRIEDTLSSLAGTIYFTSLDLKNGHWQLVLKEIDKANTAFYVG